jgi:hypothetical protein
MTGSGFCCAANQALKKVAGRPFGRAVSYTKAMAMAMAMAAKTGEGFYTSRSPSPFFCFNGGQEDSILSNPVSSSSTSSDAAAAS